MNKTVTIRIPKELDDQLVLLGEEIGLSKSTLVRVAIIKYLDVDSINDYSQVIADTKEFHRINVVLTKILQNINTKTELGRKVPERECINEKETARRPSLAR